MRVKRTGIRAWQRYQADWPSDMARDTVPLWVALWTALTG